MISLQYSCSGCTSLDQGRDLTRDVLPDKDKVIINLKLALSGGERGTITTTTGRRVTTSDDSKFCYPKATFLKPFSISQPDAAVK